MTITDERLKAEQQYIGNVSAEVESALREPPAHTSAEILTDQLIDIGNRLDTIRLIIEGRHIDPRRNAMLLTYDGRLDFEEFLLDLQAAIDKTELCKDTVIDDAIDILKKFTIRQSTRSERRMLGPIIGAIERMLEIVEKNL